MAVNYNTSIVTNGLVLCLDAANAKSYPGSGTAWSDLSGNNINLGIEGGATHNSGNKGYFSFDGNDDRATATLRTTSTEFQFTDAFTISAFCYIQENTNSGYIINNRFTDSDGTLYSGWGLFQDAGLVVGIVGGYPGGNFAWRYAGTSTTNFNTYIYNQWACITWTNTGVAGQQKLYINGIDRTTRANQDATPYSINYGNGNSRIVVGRDGVVTHPLNGRISQVSIYNRALSESEINQNFNALRGRYEI